MQFYEFKDIEERVVLIGVQTSEDEDVAVSLDELEELAETAGAVTVAKVIQNREAVHLHYIGKGKIEEVAALIQAYDANGVICDDELSPAQLNLERELDCKSNGSYSPLLILDIFAARAVSSEGKIMSRAGTAPAIARRVLSAYVNLCPDSVVESVRETLVKN